MEFLYFLEKIRTPFWDSVLSLLTHLGDEPVFLILGLLIFWCIDKYEGYYLIMVGFLGTIINQTLKIFFRIPRPWVLDNSFTVVESAKERAIGYSFPSGHTQMSVGTFGGISLWEKDKIVRFLCIAICIIVPFSRMYLGVHTPLDISISAILAVIFIFGFYPIIIKAKENTKIIPAFLAILTALLIICLAYMHFNEFPADIDTANLISGQSNLWKLLGAAIGLSGAYFIDIKYINFETKAPFPAQILKLFLGAMLVIGVKSGLKPVFNAFFSNAFAAHSIRYALTVFVACGIWPITFKYFAKLFPKKA